ncbi:hypothetical protein EDF60_1700 [Leucobacter luti]|uniref:hypothetical protein n=1 Tax=Leucobacter luti TaxID=340320 RepID=UPI00104BCA0B|nr:hypothetical protein [Leucobacter luti]MCW2287049.1 hypothetical protein [Leucobacter luti]TCK41274.1 hypothetical protein EDF60_1700 [Leucobacter luti]
MKMTLDAWGRSVDGQLIDRDGSAGAQCWDLWADYAERAVGVPIGWTYTVNRPGHPDHFLASSMFLFFPTPRVGDLSQYFVRVGRHEPAQAGDVAVWARSWSYPDTHIAVATGPAVDGMLPCWTQNPGATRHESLTTAGLLGYLRPIALIKPAASLAPKRRKQAQMFMVFYKHGNGPGKPGWLVMGTPRRLVLSSQAAADDIARQLGIGSSFVTNESGWAKFLRAAGPA